MMCTCIPKNTVTREEVIKAHISEECCTEYVNDNFKGGGEGQKKFSLTFYIGNIEFIVFSHLLCPQIL